MLELGYIEGQTVTTEYRFADGNADRLEQFAAELVNLPVDLIVADGTPASLALKRLTKTIPIVFAASADPVGTGIVASLARPGANVTGLSLMTSDLSGKRLELLQQAVPHVSRAAILWDVSNPGMELRVKQTQAAADLSRVALLRIGVRNLEELESALQGLLVQRPDLVLVTAEPFTIRHRTRILDFLLAQRIPAIFEDRTFVEAGGLMSYGPSVADNFRRTPSYVDKILKGVNPAELPVSQPTRFELVVNLKTAKAIGLVLPSPLILRADDVIS
jgi:putative ABC transport system substrate-binding protein